MNQGRAASTLGSARVKQIRVGRPPGPATFYQGIRPTREGYFARNRERIGATIVIQQTLFDVAARGRRVRRRGAAAPPIVPGSPCPKCRSLERWQDAIGRERCGVCEAEVLNNARRLAQAAISLQTRGRV